MRTKTVMKKTDHLTYVSMHRRIRAPPHNTAYNDGRIPWSKCEIHLNRRARHQLEGATQDSTIVEIYSQPGGGKLVLQLKIPSQKSDWNFEGLGLQRDFNFKDSYFP